MTAKRKRLRKLLMAMGIPRNDVEFYINIGTVMGLTQREQIEQVKGSLMDRKTISGDL